MDPELDRASKGCVGRRQSLGRAMTASFACMRTAAVQMCASLVTQRNVNRRRDTSSRACGNHSCSMQPCARAIAIAQRTGPGQCTTDVLHVHDRDCMRTCARVHAHADA